MAVSDSDCDVFEIKEDVVADMCGFDLIQILVQVTMQVMLLFLLQQGVSMLFQDGIVSYIVGLVVSSGCTCVTLTLALSII